MCGPFLKDLGTQHPGAPVDILCRPGVAGVFRGFPGVRDVFPLPSKDKNSLFKSLRARNYTDGYALSPSFSAALDLWRLGIPRRLGWATDFRRLLLTEVSPLDERFHYTRRYLQLLGHPGRPIGPEDFYFPRAPRETIDAFLKKNFMDPRRVLALAPGSRASARRWPQERFAEVIETLDPSWTGVLILGAPEDKPFADRVAHLSRRSVTNACGLTDLPLAAGLLERCAALLTNESGLMHVGWAVGIPLVVLAGPSEPQATSPFGPQVRLIQHREVPCVPCIKNTCIRWGDAENLCLKKITPPEVLEALAALRPK